MLETAETAKLTQAHAEFSGRRYCEEFAIATLKSQIIYDN